MFKNKYEARRIGHSYVYISSMNTPWQAVCFTIGVLCISGISQLATSDEGDNKIRNENRELANINGSYYFISTIRIQVQQAVETCNDLGMKLISIQTPEKQESIVNYLDNNGHQDKNCWTSGFRLNSTTFVWGGTGQMVSWTNWDARFPWQDSSVAHINLALGTYKEERKWFDVQSNRTFNFICEQLDKFD